MIPAQHGPHDAQEGQEHPQCLQTEVGHAVRGHRDQRRQQGHLHAIATTVLEEVPQGNDGGTYRIANPTYPKSINICSGSFSTKENRTGRPISSDR